MTALCTDGQNNVQGNPFSEYKPVVLSRCLPHKQNAYDNRSYLACLVRLVSQLRGKEINK
jgi:hypothetical protein